MAVCTLSPSPKQYFFDPATGEPLANGFVYTYAAGTSSPATTYQDALGASANDNPIQLNGFGYCTIFLPIATSYKFVVTNALGVTVWTQDNISAVPPSSANLDIAGTYGEAIAVNAPVYLSDGSGGKQAGQWFNASNTNAYSSTTPDIGFALVAGSAATVGSIRQGGVLTGLSGLSAGAVYFIGSSGTITATQPILARTVGQADTTSTLNVQIGSSASGVPTLDNGINDFRLSLTTALAITTTDVTAAGTIYAVPFKGNRIALYDANGNAFIFTSAQISIAVPAATSQMHDVFGYQSAGVFTLELLAWTNDTTRATAIVANVASGVWTKSGDATRRYLGSVRTTTVANQTEDSLVKRYLYNEYNQVTRALQRIETTASWPYTISTYRQARAAAANQVEVVVGTSEQPVTLELIATAANDTGSITGSVAIGLDSTTTAASNQIRTNIQLTTANIPAAGVARYLGYPGVGLHTFVWLEKSGAAGTTTWSSANNNYAEQSGLIGSCLA